MRRQGGSRLLAPALLASFALAGPAPAQQDVEWEPGEGYHEEEWYDPSDWFNDDGQVSYEYDGYDVYEPYDYRSDDVYDDEWQYGYHYDYASDEWNRGWHYEPHSEDVDYGWHFDDMSNDWQYGYHYDEYEYYTDEWWNS